MDARLLLAHQTSAGTARPSAPDLHALAKTAPRLTARPLAPTPFASSLTALSTTALVATASR